MGRIELLDKKRDFVSVTEEYLRELYDEIEALKALVEVLKASQAPRP